MGYNAPTEVQSRYRRSSFDQVGVDREGRFGAFGGGDDDPLHRARGVAGDEQPGRWVVSYLPVRTVPFSLNSQPRRVEQVGPLRLPGREEQRAPRQTLARRRRRCARGCRRVPSSAATRSSRSAMPLRASRARPSRRSRTARRCRARGRGSTPSARATGRGRARRGRRSRAADREPPSRRSTGSETRCARTARGSPRSPAGCRTTPVAISSLRREMLSPVASVTSNRASGAHSASTTSTSRSATVSYRSSSSRPIAQELARRHAVAGQVAVQRVRGGVARPPGVADEHRAAAAAEHERGAQPRGPGAHDDDVVHGAVVGVGSEVVVRARMSPSQDSSQEDIPARDKI